VPLPPATGNSASADSGINRMSLTVVMGLIACALVLGASRGVLKR
jgi:hypothetical protein